ncbi:MAG: glycosyltransferase family 2 protein [Leptolyngbyaceae cyanobacterium CSU_1_3]|nr:glycosyltransferase family 2 protein [Leptolyngbyaceae cyanobacterium CSU_1_3]
MFMVEKLTIVIPTFNEASRIENTLAISQMAANAEIIVVDGGSHDHTVQIAQAAGVKVLRSRPGRAHQMNRGASAAIGDILLFLHADTQLPQGFDSMIRAALSQPMTIAGAFSLKIDASLWSLRLVEWGVNLRSRLLQMPYGDQAIFLRADTFRAIGGFPDLPIMEDFELIRQLKQRGQIAILPASVVTSSRRWQKLGVLQTTLINQSIILAYLCGISPSQIAHWYRTKPKHQ